MTKQSAFKRAHKYIIMYHNNIHQKWPNNYSLQRIETHHTEVDALWDFLCDAYPKEEMIDEVEALLKDLEDVAFFLTVQRTEHLYRAYMDRVKQNHRQQHTIQSDDIRRHQ